MSAPIWPWITLALLGAYHGINPGMGWLFAVALGMQEKSGRAVVRSLIPIGLGHAISIGLTVGLLLLGQASLSTQVVEYATGILLIGFGIYKLVRSRHPRWVGMRVGFRDLFLWSFLMASAHGAGLMLLPVFLLGEDNPAPCHGPGCHQAAGLSLNTWQGYLAALFLHTGAMLVTAAAIALLVYYKFGLAMLRRSWLNLDMVWAVSLLLAGMFALAAGTGWSIL